MTWFNMAMSRLTEEEMAERDTEFGFFSYANNILAGRQRVRDVLGMTPDEWDESVQTLTEHAKDFTEGLLPSTPPGEVRVLFWPRDELPRAHEAWPQFVEHADADAITTEREISNRELVESGVARIVMVPLTAATLVEFAARTGGDPTRKAPGWPA